MASVNAENEKSSPSMVIMTGAFVTNPSVTLNFFKSRLFIMLLAFHLGYYVKCINQKTFGLVKICGNKNPSVIV